MLTRVLRYTIMVLELRATAGMDKHIKTLQGICEDWLIPVKHTQTSPASRNQRELKVLKSSEKH